MILSPINGYAYSDYIIASGENIGIKLNTKGIIVIGKYNDLNPILQKGDIITSINGNKNISIDNIDKLLKNKNNKIGYIHNGSLNYIDLNIENGKTGLYLKDSISGIGTMTFIDPNSKIYGALGHEIIDSNSGLIIDNKNGNIFDSTVSNIKKSTKGNPGEKNAKIRNNEIIGDIDSNTNKGIFGDYSKDINNDNLYKVALSNEIKTGKAYILTELENNEVEKYEINITKLNKESNTKNIFFEVKDKKLLEIGGIVQGMSGSPIIQDDKIIGAVTHVVIDNPKTGYGIFITNMLEEAEKKDK